MVCIGPLTNIATAVKKDKTFGSRLKECFIMGGNYYGNNTSRENSTTNATISRFQYSTSPSSAIFQHHQHMEFTFHNPYVMLELEPK
jgi:inosine-uridine nucleoside N-ribohydrolase